jgi:hypothetical protein
MPLDRDPQAPQPGSDYTPGEIAALVAPLFGLEPDELEHVYMVVITSTDPPRLAVQTNINAMDLRLQILLHTIQYEVTTHTIPLTAVCLDPACPAAGTGPHVRMLTCPLPCPEEDGS